MHTILPTLVVAYCMFIFLRIKHDVENPGASCPMCGTDDPKRHHRDCSWK